MSFEKFKSLHFWQISQIFYFDFVCVGGGGGGGGSGDILRMQVFYLF